MACPAIVYAEIVVVIDLFFVGVCPWIKVYRYNPTEICQQRLQGVRNVAKKFSRGNAALGPKLSSCGQRKLWSDWADAQADVSLRWAHTHFVGFVAAHILVISVKNIIVKKNIEEL